MSKSKSRLLSPKAWYLVVAGGVALAADGVRRLLRRRKVTQSPVIQPERGQSITITDERPPVMTTLPAAPVAAPPAPAVSPKPPKAAKAATPAKPVTPDDLTAIKGIGPVFAKRLNEAGITTFAGLAAASADQLQEMTKATATAKPEEWIAQARTMK